MGLAIKIYGVSFEDNNIGQVTEALPIESITLGSDFYIYNNKNVAVCKATIIPNNTPDKNVIWSITDGSSYASIDQTGKLTILSGADGNSVTVKAVSRINPEVFATLTIRVKYTNNPTTGVYNYFRNGSSDNYLTSPASGHAAFADTTFREIEYNPLAGYYLNLKSSVSYTISGYAYTTFYDEDFNVLGTLLVSANIITGTNGANINYTSYKDDAKYVSISFDIYATTSTSSLMDATKDTYENVVFTGIKSSDTTISFTNFITID